MSLHWRFNILTCSIKLLEVIYIYLRTNFLLLLSCNKYTFANEAPLNIFKILGGISGISILHKPVFQIESNPFAMR